MNTRVKFIVSWKIALYYKIFPFVIVFIKKSSGLTLKKIGFIDSIIFRRG